MRRLLLGLFLALLPWQASAKITIRAGYHAPADLFSVMDQTTLWYEGFNDRAYREAWTERFGWSDDDQDMANRYKKYRKRTFNDRTQTDKAYRARRDGIFAALSSFSSMIDPLAEHFIASRTIPGALSTLETIASAEDAQMLRSFYAHFRPKWQLLLKESEAFVSQATTLNEDLTGDRVDAYLARMSGFYRIDADLEFNAFFVWWPPIDRTLADVSGQTIFLRLNPIKHADKGGWAEIVMHEAVHYISAHQPPEQKRALTEEFLEICPAKTENLYDLLEEPLAIAWGQAAFAKYGRGKPLDPSENWYRRPMPAVMGRLLWLNVGAIYKTDATITDGLIRDAAGYCAHLLDIGETVKRKRK